MTPFNMNKILNIALACLLGTTTATAANVIPMVSVTASNSEGAMLSANIANKSGLSKNSPDGLHDNSSTGATMWRSRATLYSDVRVTFDLQKEYNLDKVYIWNFNQAGHTNCGVKDMRIEYSNDKNTWTSFPVPSSIASNDNESYPWRLAQASGEAGLAATNVTDANGKSAPVDMTGISAQYVRFVIPRTFGTGNYGGEGIGLSEVMFTTNDEITGLGAKANFSDITGTFGNMVFGGCQNPSVPHSKKVLTQLCDAGFNCMRCDMWIEKIVPQNITLDDYKNNVNDVQNPDTWNFADLELAVRAKLAGMKVMLIIAYCPAWLSYNGKSNGVPCDLDVYADIVRKIYKRYHSYVDWIEVYNEPGYFLTTEGSPYTSRGTALADIYMTCVNVVREITPDMPIGGTSVVTSGDGGVGGITNRDFFADKRINKDNFNFYSHHVYGDYGIETVKETPTRVRNLLANFGFGDLPIYFTEWSTSINNAADSVTYRGSKAHLFVGNALLNWMRDGLTGAMHWNYLQAEAVNGASESGISADGHGMYVWDVRNKESRLLPKANVFRLLSKTLSLGKAENRVVSCNLDNASDYINVASFISSDGVKSTVFVNNDSSEITINLTTDTEFSSAEIHTVTQYADGIEGKKIQPNGKNLTLTLAPLSVTGIKYAN